MTIPLTIYADELPELVAVLGRYGGSGGPLSRLLSRAVPLVEMAARMVAAEEQRRVAPRLIDASHEREFARYGGPR